MCLHNRWREVKYRLFHWVRIHITTPGLWYLFNGCIWFLLVAATSLVVRMKNAWTPATTILIEDIDVCFEDWNAPYFTPRNIGSGGGGGSGGDIIGLIFVLVLMVVLVVVISTLFRGFAILVCLVRIYATHNVMVACMCLILPLALVLVLVIKCLHRWNMRLQHKLLMVEAQLGSDDWRHWVLRHRFRAPLLGIIASYLPTAPPETDKETHK